MDMEVWGLCMAPRRPGMNIKYAAATEELLSSTDLVLAQVGGDMEGARVQHVSVGLQHVAALAVSTQMRQLPGRAQARILKPVIYDTAPLPQD